MANKYFHLESVTYMHVYEPKSFTEQQEKILRDTASKSYYQENFLTQQEFDFCRDIVLSVHSWPEHGHNSKYWGFGDDTGLGPELGWLLHKIKCLIPKSELDFFAVQEAILPWKIHADIRWYADKIPYKVVLLPMDVETISGPVPVDQWPDTYTITFDQRNYLSRWPGDANASHGNNDQSKWQAPIDNPQVEDCIQGYAVSQDTWQEYFTHVPYGHLQGLTVDQINRWRPGSIMHWDNTALHCADNFLSRGIRTKRSLMLFMHYVE